jgi:hypothetical protein
VFWQHEITLISSELRSGREICAMSTRGAVIASSFWEWQRTAKRYTH